jgi:hypothetical protein
MILLQANEFEIGLYPRQKDGEADSFLLAAQRLFYIMDAVDEDLIAGNESGDKKGETLNVIPVKP